MELKEAIKKIREAQMQMNQQTSQSGNAFLQRLIERKMKEKEGQKNE